MLSEDAIAKLSRQYPNCNIYYMSCYDIKLEFGACSGSVAVPEMER